MNVKNSLAAGKLFRNIPRITDYQTRKAWEQSVWKTLLGRLDEATAATLPLITSADERRMIVYRVTTISRLQAGIGPSEISRELWLSRQTISAIKKGLLENEYQSSHGRGHKKRTYSPDLGGGSSSRKEYHRYRNTKYGKVRLH